MRRKEGAAKLHTTDGPSYTPRTVRRYTTDDKEREIFKIAGKATLHDGRLGLYDFPPLLGVRFTFNVLNEGHILC